ncbi:hypothetical protein HYR99_40165 [Candidatus Poribacteria bacterium]|nr:hypothetical protein [Candidatus Poribacteria bacterium]
MGAQVTVTLSEAVYHRAELLAQLTDRDVVDVLEDTIELSLSPLNPHAKAFKPISALSDEEVLNLTELQMDETQDRRLSALLDQHGAGELTEAEHIELWTLMQLYQEGLLQKARALHEAVQRGLREPLEP